MAEEKYHQIWVDEKTRIKIKTIAAQKNVSMKEMLKKMADFYESKNSKETKR